jgi:hypothetical protein
MELDIWQYIAIDNIEVANPYVTALNPVVRHDWQRITVDDSCFPSPEKRAKCKSFVFALSAAIP